MTAPRLERVEDQAQVYRLYDADGVLLYVGMAADPVLRFQEHAKAYWWRWASRHEVGDPIPRGEAAKEEESAIRSEAPVFNTCHNTDGLAQRIAYTRAQDAAERGATPAGQGATQQDSGLFMRVPVAWVREVGLEAAAVFSMIVWKSQDGEGWAATRKELAEETGLTQAKIRTALDVLRRVGWLTSQRVASWDATQCWIPVFAEESSQVIPRVRQASSRDDATAPHGNPTPAISSYTEEEELPLVVPTVVKPRKRATRLPADFRPKEAHFALAASLGVDLRHEGPQFMDHHTAKGSTFKDWDAALRTWIRNAAKFAKEREPEPSRDTSPASWSAPYTPAAERDLPPPRPEGWVAGW